MIIKEDFMDIVNAAARTLRSIQRLEEALGAIHLLEMKTPEDEEMDAFVQCYWNLVQDDESLLIFPNQEQIVIHDSDMFYDFWAGRKENFPIECRIYDPHNYHGWR